MPKGNIAEICGKFTIRNPEKESWKLLNTFPGVPTNNDYIVLDTDYKVVRPSPLQLFLAPLLEVACSLVQYLNEKSTDRWSQR